MRKNCATRILPVNGRIYVLLPSVGLLCSGLGALMFATSPHFACSFQEHRSSLQISRGCSCDCCIEPLEDDLPSGKRHPSLLASDCDTLADL